MHVLHLGKYFDPFRGGIENFTRLLALGTRDAGHQVSLLVHAHEGGRSEEVLESGIRLVRSRVLGRWMYTPLAPFFLFDLWRLLSRNRPDVLHVHLPNVSAFWLLLCPPAWRIPWILHWHSDVEFDSDERLGRWLYRWCYRPLEWLLLKRAAAVICTSPNYLRASEALQAFHGKSRIVPLSCEVAAEGSAENPEWPAGKLRLLMVGRLTPYKGHGVLLNALAELEERGIEVATVLVGAGKPEAELFSAAQCLFLERRVSMLSGLDDGQLSALYDSCDLVCLPSLNRAEAFGMVLLEAMTHGKPVVASELLDSGVSWVVEHDRTGWLFPVADSDALAERLAWCLEHPEALREAGEHARRRFEERFAREQVLGETLQCYSEVLCDRGR